MGSAHRAAAAGFAAAARSAAAAARHAHGDIDVTGYHHFSGAHTFDAGFKLHVDTAACTGRKIKRIGRRRSIAAGRRGLKVAIVLTRKLYVVNAKRCADGI